MKQYKTIQGDTFDIIAKKFYGSEKYTKDLLYANLELASTVIFSSGTVINLPDIDTSITPSSLSPWREA